MTERGGSGGELQVAQALADFRGTAGAARNGAWRPKPSGLASPSFVAGSSGPRIAGPCWRRGRAAGIRSTTGTARGQEIAMIRGGLPPPFSERDRPTLWRGWGRTLRSRPRGVDPEIAEDAGPQLVVPVTNARFALKRGECAVGVALRRTLRHRRAGLAARAGKGYDPLARRGGDPPGAKAFLDEAAPSGRGEPRLRREGYRVETGVLRVTVAGGRRVLRTRAPRFPPRHAEGRILCRTTGLKIELVIRPDNRDLPLARSGPEYCPMCGSNRAISTIMGLRGFGGLRRCPRGQGRGPMAPGSG